MDGVEFKERDDHGDVDDDDTDETHLILTNEH